MPEEIMSKREQLAEVNQAISAIMRTGQSYTIGSRSLTRASLPDLYKMQADLEAKIAAEENNSPLFSNCTVAFFEGR